MRRSKTNHLENLTDGFTVLFVSAVVVGLLFVVFTVLGILLRDHYWETVVATVAIVSVVAASYIVGYLLNTDDVLKKAYKRIVNSVRHIF